MSKHPSKASRGRPSAPERLLFALALFLAAALAQAAGTVTHLSGVLIAKNAAGTSRTVSVNSIVNEGDTLFTQEGTYARVKFEDGSEVVLRPNSQFEIQRYRFKEAEPESDNIFVSLVKGGMRAVTGLLGKRHPDRVSVNTPTATIGIRGTHFGLLFCQGDCGDIPTITGRPPENGLHIDVASGAVQVSNPAGQQLIGAGQFGFVGGLNMPPVIVPPSQGIQVTLPPNIVQNNASGRNVGKGQGAAECSVQ